MFYHKLFARVRNGALILYRVSRKRPGIAVAAFLSLVVISIVLGGGSADATKETEVIGGASADHEVTEQTADISTSKGKRTIGRREGPLLAEAPAEAVESPYVLISRTRDQLDQEIDRLLGSLEDTCDAVEMAEIRTLRRVYGTDTFLRELGTFFDQPGGTKAFSDSQRTELNRLCNRWDELEQLMIKLALTQE